MSTNFHTNVGSADIAAFLQFQTVSDLFQTSFGTSAIFHTNVGSADIAAFLQISDGFRPVSDLFGTSANFHTNVGSADIAAFLQFQTCFRPLWDVRKFPYKCRISGYSCFPTVSDGFRPVSDLFGMSTNFHTNVGSADIAAFLRFQTVSDLFQTSLGCPQISIQM